MIHTRIKSITDLILSPIYHLFSSGPPPFRVAFYPFPHSWGCQLPSIGTLHSFLLSTSQRVHPLYTDINEDDPITFEMSTIAPNALRSSKPPIDPLSFEANQPETIRLYPLSNYTFGVKETQPEEDPSVVARLKRLEEHYVQHGMRRTCEGILVCHEHNHPHILMLQIANAFFKLPGDYLKPEDDEIEGFKKRLDERLAPVGSLGDGQTEGDWNIGDCLAQWWRPNFETFMYPFVPAHCTRPKECKKLYIIKLPESSELP